MSQDCRHNARRPAGTARWRMLLLAWAGLIAVSPGAHAALEAYEGFDYVAGTGIAGQSGGDSFGWSGIWATGGNNVYGTNVSGSLSYTDFFGNELITHAGSMVAGSGTSSSAATPNRSLTNTLSHGAARSVWISFLAQRIGPTNGAPNPPIYDRQANLGLFQGSSERLCVGRPNTNSFTGAPYDTWSLWHQNGSANNGTAYAQATTYPLNNPAGASFIVLRIDTDAGGAADTSYLWVNWHNLAVAPDPAAATLTNANQVELSAVETLRLAANGASGALANAFMQFDELRVGSTFADVAPYGTNSAPLSRLIITNALLTSDGLVSSGTGGTFGGVYRMLSTTDPTPSGVDWITIVTNAFDSHGNFLVTNPITPGAGQEFFRVLLGGYLPPPPVPPAISSQPRDLTIDVGESAMFSVTATGSEPLFYQWYFNTNTVLAGQTNAILSILNAQWTNSGRYHAQVTNSAGSDVSDAARLVVIPQLPPMIVSQPQNLVAREGQTAVLTVVANGHGTLEYQWFYNHTNQVSGATNPALVLLDVQSTNAGVYSVLIVNDIGLAPSEPATLSVEPAGDAPDFGLKGYAAAFGGTTGGQGGPTVTASTRAELVGAMNQPGPQIVQVTGTIDLGFAIFQNKSHKTIVGHGANATLLGNLQFQACTNIIVRNLTSIHPAGDGMSIQDFSEHIWVDHCAFGECGDGQIDITHGADWITVSWCTFGYTNADNTHRFSSLVGHDDTNDEEDSGRLHITYHHNWWGALVRERMPRVRFGHVHVFNTYFNSPGNNYCTLAAFNSQLVIESNYYQDVDEPWRKDFSGSLRGSNNLFVNCTGISASSDAVLAPAYSYVLEPAAAVPGIVTNNAGPGKGPFGL